MSVYFGQVSWLGAPNPYPEVAIAVIVTVRSDLFASDDSNREEALT